MEDRDLIVRLRSQAFPDPSDEREVVHAPLLREAADEIETLRRERDEFKALAMRQADTILALEKDCEGRGLEWKRMARMYVSMAHQHNEAASEWKRRAQAIFDELTKEWIDPDDDWRTLMDPCYDEIRTFAKWFEEEK